MYVIIVKRCILQKYHEILGFLVVYYQYQTKLLLMIKFSRPVTFHFTVFFNCLLSENPS
jgi:hypothetical protein